MVIQPPRGGWLAASGGWYNAEAEDAPGRAMCAGRKTLIFPHTTEGSDRMGKLLDKLRHVSQVNGTGFGFLGARTEARKPRPAAVVVTLSTADIAAAEAITKAGVDAVIVTDWRPGADLAQFKAALGSGDSSPVWGVELSAPETTSPAALEAAHNAGAAFVVMSQQTPASALVAAQPLDGLETVVAIEPPRDDLGLLLVRAENLLPADAAILRAQLSPADLSTMDVGGFARLRLLNESLRFPVLFTVTQAPDEAQTRLLARVGVRGVILPGVKTAGAALAEQVRTLREYLERTPANDDDRTGVAIGGLMASHTPSLEPEHEPGREPGRPQPGTPHEPTEP